VRVITLGGFDLELDGVPYRPARKAQDRPLDLLKLLAVHDSAQAGRLSKPHAALLLWPDADEGNALKSLDMAIGRLRKLLGRDDAVLVSDGRLTLAPALVWVDLRGLNAALSRLRSAPTPAALDMVLSLYRGPLLDGDNEVPWLLGPRRALWDAVRAAVLAATHAPALSPHADALRAALERLQAIDPTAEDVAQARMQWHRARGETAQALAVYAALRSALGAVHGVAPGAATEQLRTQVLAAADPGAAAAAQVERLSAGPVTRG
jgi:DNA-binding SARP family transcriptional activator